MGFWKRTSPDRPGKIQGGRGTPATPASTHVHNDNGRSYRSGKFIITCCTCGAQVARDFAPGQD